MTNTSESFGPDSGVKSTHDNRENNSNDERVGDILRLRDHAGRFLVPHGQSFPSVPQPESVRAAQPRGAAAVPGGRPLRAAQLHLRRQRDQMSSGMEGRSIIITLSNDQYPANVRLYPRTRTITAETRSVRRDARRAAESAPSRTSVTAGQDTTATLAR